MTDIEHLPLHPTDEHPEVPPTSAELDIADSDRRAVEARERQAELERIRQEPETPEERQHRLDQLDALRKRYGSDRAA